MLEALKESLAAIRDCVDASRMREKRRFYELWNQPRKLIERDDVAFHYFYAGRLFSICRHGILSKNELNRRGWSDEEIKPTHTPICEGQDHYSQIWFSNVDYSTAVHMPPFMRHSRKGDLWGLGAARVVIDQAGLSLWLLIKRGFRCGSISNRVIPKMTCRRYCANGLLSTDRKSRPVHSFELSITISIRANGLCFHIRRENHARSF